MTTRAVLGAARSETTVCGMIVSMRICDQEVMWYE